MNFPHKGTVMQKIVCSLFSCVLRLRKKNCQSFLSLFELCAVNSLRSHFGNGLIMSLIQLFLNQFGLFYIKYNNSTKSQFCICYRISVVACLKLIPDSILGIKLKQTKFEQYLNYKHMNQLFVAEAGNLRSRLQWHLSWSHTGNWVTEVTLNLGISSLRPRQMDAISQTTFSNAFFLMKMFEFRLKFYWSLFPRVQSTILQQWFR